MTKNLLIVESPSKAKTLKKYLGQDYEILASYGHVRDLVPKAGAVDPEHDFAMKYDLVARNKKYVDAIIKAAKESDHIYLATDPDREGEAISWHLDELLKKRGKGQLPHAERVTFNEITKSAVIDALAHPRELYRDLIDAQQARRALDYLVGFNLSPLLWKKIQRGLSAGRVQSPALRLICEREAEIQAFVPREYWSVHLKTHKEKTSFVAKLIEYQGQKAEQFFVTSEAQNKDIVAHLEGAEATVAKVTKKERKRKAAAPFTTSTLQQEAVRKLNMTTKQAMRVAQQLYEGIDIGGGAVGLITYMRTDSVTLSQESINDIRAFIGENWGEEFLPKTPNFYKTKAKNAQEAHEAIRPTAIHRTPKELKSHLTPEQFKLYQMIWQRALASQMAEARFDTTTIDLTVKDALFRATGQILTFKGFLEVYEEGSDDTKDPDKGILPDVTVGETLPADEIYGEQHFTQPPPHYTEASLVKELEEHGIGRPSTYASIISTLKDREYVTLNQKQFIPTDTGNIVNKFLTQHFTRYVDYDFTAKMEGDLDDIASGKTKWLAVMRDFWGDFDRQLKEKADLSRKEVTTEELDEICPKCKKHKLQIKYGRRERFIACSGYPECDYTRNINETAAEREAAEESKDVGRECPKCGGALIYKRGRYGKFIGCSNYPKCKYIEPLEKPRDTGIECPKCKKGTLIEKKSRYGKMFYGCSGYPDCDYATWNEPINEPCPKCGWPIMTLKTTKRRGTEKVCPQKDCGFSISVPAAEES